MIRFGVIGTSKITDQFITAAQLVKGLELAAVYSRTQERGEEFAQKHGIKNIFTDLEELAKSDLIDAIYIASPNSFHSQQAILFLNHKKHVLCEKPLASNTKEVTAMIQAAKTNDVLLMEAMKSAFFPNHKVIKANLHKLGKIRRFFFSYCQYSSRYDKFKEGIHVNTFDTQFSNGSLMDIGVYCVHPAILFFGSPKNVKASAYKLSSGVDGEGALLLAYEDMDGVIMHSKIADSKIPCEIQGEEGTMIIDKINDTGKVYIVYKNGRTEDLSVHQIEDNMYYEIEEFIKLLTNNKKESDLNSYNQSLKVIEVMDTARQQTGVTYPADQL